MHPDLPFAQRTLDWAHSRGICVHLLFGFVMRDKCGCCVGERMAGFLPMSLTTSVAIPMDVAPRTRNNAQRRARAWFCPRRKARHCVWRGGGVAAGCTGNDRWRSADSSGGRGRATRQTGTRPRESKAHAHRPASTRGKAHAHLCVVALLGGGWLSLSGGRRESGLPPTFVSVRSVVTDLSTCVTYVSAHLKHTCVKSYHNGTFL